MRPLTSQRTLKTIEVQSGKTAGDAPVLRHLHIYLVTRQTLIQLREAEEMTGKSILLGIYTWNSIQGAMVHHASPFQKQSVHRRLSDCAILRIEGFEFSLEGWSQESFSVFHSDEIIFKSLFVWCMFNSCAIEEGRFNIRAAQHFVKVDKRACCISPDFGNSFNLSCFLFEHFHW